MPAQSYNFLSQLIWVIDGELTFQEGQTCHLLRVGDCLQLGPPQDCCFKNITDQMCRYLVALSKH